MTMTHQDSSTSAAPGASPDSSGDTPPGCPICEFIEAGPCGDPHKVWVACRGEAQQQDVDFVQHCSTSFRTFFGCMLSNQDYYKPFLEAFHVDTDLSQQAIDKAESRQQQEAPPQNEQQQQQAEPAQTAAAGVAMQQQQNLKAASTSSSSQHTSTQSLEPQASLQSMPAAVPDTASKLSSNAQAAAIS